MKKTAFAILVSTFVFGLILSAQNPPPVSVPPPAGQAPGAAPAAQPNPLADYTRQIKYDGLTLSIVLVNNRTAEVLFQAPMKYSMRARSAQQTVLYVQGTPQKDFDFTNTFSIIQENETLAGTSTSMKNFVTG